MSITGFMGFWFGRLPGVTLASAASDVSDAKRSYAEVLDKTITIRRYTGTGNARTYSDFDCRGTITGYAPAQLVGNIVQGDRRVIVYSDDLTNAGFDEPITKDDKVVRGGKEIAIIGVDDSTRRIDDVLIAYELQARG
jgi:hypothetical protein